MKPSELSATLRRIAARIEASRAPRRDLVTRELHRVLAAMKSYNVGDKVTWNSMGVRKTGIVIGREEDIKNGRPGFDAELPDGNTAWGYDHDIISVKPSAA
jgi:hypothetical protein